MKNNKKSGENPDVKLKPVLGISPPVYMLIFFGLVVAFLFWLVLFLPGIITPGTSVFFDTYPGKAMVTIDGILYGVTPCRVVLDPGIHEYTLSKQFFPGHQGELIIARRLPSFFYPKEINVIHKLEGVDAGALLEYSKKEFIEYGMNSSFPVGSALPPILSNMVLSLVKTGSSIRASAFIDNSIYFIDSRQEMKEFIKCQSIPASNGGPLSPQGAINLLSKIIHFKENCKQFPFWLQLNAGKLKTVQEGAASDILENSAWFRSRVQEYKNTLEENSPAVGLEKRQIEGMKFHEIPGGTVLSGDLSFRLSAGFPPRMEQLETIFMSETEVTNLLYHRFVLANPDWSKKSLAALVAEKKVNSDYLMPWGDEYPPGSREDHPVTHVSYYSAIAFCEWFSRLVREDFPGFEARLPFEAELEFQAMAYGGIPANAVMNSGYKGLQKAGTSDTNSFGIRDIWGNVWEWCEDWYLPNRNTLYSLEGREGQISPEKVVKGGSWENIRGEFRAFTRGSQPPDWCTSSLGFRIVLMEKKNG